ncbi:hypothetical protein MJO28_014849 [Puccinia striiformis f. sp. tritici]|uniref:Uncharacterized protein n=3 Tax=Puccinia striiformis TaxID=27350 RepID=A0A2S4V0P3_9BASI|nr:uncharacterized protein Pst134EA_032696 [Puccinia striiformis f. sp. tritici]XP_047798608.1 hypothetical protein Pst134EA_027729 [Puccinia striiformis f. sp. tritici]KAI9625212.1 hypothetical protein H4Q26_016403 [Puccinia striiformis f. sp. tritici PST-130]POW03071.1 hypothetical protein PSTT_11345 [Puccinia striiformis]KAH9443454.1 hypothetical protein Pst134EA_032696 [Puccinia striiformis f. sp. tritici]KAH9448418.1 hypothetical protein Pst134EA_027729 [Puccinia striiformis f. sp. tritic
MQHLLLTIAFLVALCHLAQALPKVGSTFPCHSPGFPRCSWTGSGGYSLGQALPIGDKYGCYKLDPGWCCPTNKIRNDIGKAEFDQIISKCFKMTE